MTNLRSPLPGFEERHERKHLVELRIEELMADGLSGDRLAERVRRQLGEDGLRVLRGMVRGAKGQAMQRQTGLFDAPRDDDKTRNAFARMAIDDLFASARGMQEMVPLLGFLGRARDNVYNAMVVYVQNPRARDWRSREDWKKAKRVVREGAQPLLTLFPFGPFKIKYDVADTDGPELERGAGLLDGAGQVSRQRWTRVRQKLGEEGFHLRETRPMESRAAGFVRCDPDGVFDIAIEMRAPLAAQFGTLCHELAHVYLGHLGPDRRTAPRKDGRRPTPRWPSRANLPRAVQELEAEGVAFILCCRLGLLTPAPEYIAGYLDQLPPDEVPGVEMMVRAASAISRLVLA